MYMIVLRNRILIRIIGTGIVTCPTDSRSRDPKLLELRSVRVELNRRDQGCEIDKLVSFSREMLKYVYDCIA